MLGAAFLSRSDVEIDLRDRMINLFAPSRCPGSAVYWPTDMVLDAPFRLTARNEIEVAATIAGEPTTALLDTGSPHDALGADLAAALGADSRTSIAGSRPSPTGSRLPSLRIGGETLRNFPVLLPQDATGDSSERALDRALGRRGDATRIGLDFFLRNRVYIAYQARVIYFTPYAYRLSSDSAEALADKLLN